MISSERLVVRCSNCGESGHGLWHFLNEGLPSAVIGGLIFAVVAGLIVWQLTSVGETAGLRARLPTLLATEIAANQQTAEGLRTVLDGPGGMVVAQPFRVSALRVVLQGRYAEALAPELVFTLADLYDELGTANQLHHALRDRQLEEDRLGPDGLATELLRRELVGTLRALEPRLQDASTALAETRAKASG